MLSCLLSYNFPVFSRVFGIPDFSPGEPRKIPLRPPSGPRPSPARRFWAFCTLYAPYYIVYLPVILAFYCFIWYICPIPAVLPSPSAAPEPLPGTPGISSRRFPLSMVPNGGSEAVWGQIRASRSFPGRFSRHSLSILRAAPYEPFSDASGAVRQVFPPPDRSAGDYFGALPEHLGKKGRFFPRDVFRRASRGRFFFLPLAQDRVREILLTALRIWDDTRRMIPARTPHMGRCTPDVSRPESSAGPLIRDFSRRISPPEGNSAAGSGAREKPAGIPLNPRFKTGSFPVDFADFESGLFRPPLRGGSGGPLRRRARGHPGRDLPGNRSGRFVVNNNLMSTNGIFRGLSLSIGL